MIKIIICLVSLAFTTAALAQSTEKQRTISAELNPIAYAFGGWSISAAFKPKKIPNWVFNTGAYSFNFPEVFTEQIAGNAGEGFNVNLKTAFTIGSDYYPWSKNRKGFAFGLSVVYGNFEITNQTEAGKANYNSLYFVPRASFTWYAFKGLYVMPWLGVEQHNKLSGSTAVGAKEFEPIKFQFSPNLTMGYSFN
jgi:hypothetical protein